MQKNNEFVSFFIKNYNIFCDNLIANIEDISCCVKNPAFKEEEESRIILTTSMSPDYPCLRLKEYLNETRKINGYILNPIKYYNKSNQLIAYTDLYFGDFIQKNIITDIYLGPKCKLNINDLKFYLAANGFDHRNIQIEPSKATYR